MDHSLLVYSEMFSCVHTFLAIKISVYILKSFKFNLMYKENIETVKLNNPYSFTKRKT